MMTSGKMMKIAAITMLRNDEQFLQKWITWYGGQLGRENLFVYFDGTDQNIPDFCEGIHTEKVRRIEGQVRQGDKGRIAFLSEAARQLFCEKTYDMVIGTDVDEFLIPDPALGIGLYDFLQHFQACGRVSISGLGIDVGQKMGEEGRIDWSRPLLSQRSYAKLSTRYSKSSVLFKPSGHSSSPQWGSGFHRVRGHNFHIVKDLYLFHFGSIDLERIEGKMRTGDLVAKGWGRHLAKRTRTITLVSKKKARDWNKLIPAARFLQNCVRPPYAWNKPAMFEWQPIVRIPQRFQGII